MANTKKPAAMMSALAQEMKIRFSATSWTISESSDSDGNPTLSITDASPVVTEANLLIRIKPVDLKIDQKDALGLAQRVFGPHSAEVLRQSDVGGAAIAVAASHMEVHASVFMLLGKLGIAIDLFNQAAGGPALPANSDWATAVKAGHIRSNLINPLVGEV